MEQPSFAPTKLQWCRLWDCFHGDAESATCCLCWVLHLHQRPRERDAPVDTMSCHEELTSLMCWLPLYLQHCEVESSVRKICANSHSVIAQRSEGSDMQVASEVCYHVWWLVRWNTALHCSWSIVQNDCQRQGRRAADNAVNGTAVLRQNPWDASKRTILITFLKCFGYTVGIAVAYFALLATIVVLTRTWRRHWTYHYWVEQVTNSILLCDNGLLGNQIC